MEYLKNHNNLDSEKSCILSLPGMVTFKNKIITLKSILMQSEKTIGI